MHPSLRAILIRFALMGAAFVALGGAAALYVPGIQEQVARHTSQVPDITPPALPDAAWRTTIAAALDALGKGPTQAAINTLETSLISQRTTTGRTATRLTLIVPQGAERLALIDGRVFRVGDKLPDGRRVHAISPQGVLLEAAGALEMVPWIPPLAVRLERASQETPAFANATLEAPAQTLTNASATQGPKSINADQAIQLLRQWEALKHAR
ncbi:hypothetical protein TDMWS_21620 [Thermodesulfomicrobium sp. WS]|uniref:hypothetical protein n=1 Tax=Thermodesulfomicrobium sp. WS TaxID=3004129 RepID=UPI002493A0FB|nr:hypothetical protein [Thermodesulfomicrobium sp. WS]BDV02077.1 hypothetical protein TDMWS_21620 [Thermodesulfomicrobium sp. WS]